LPLDSGSPLRGVQNDRRIVKSKIKLSNPGRVARMKDARERAFARRPE
jgi:hypothetical protein